MPKYVGDRLSGLQESILLAMDYIERRSGGGGLISGTAIAKILGGRWSDHRAKTMEALAQAPEGLTAWITIHTMAHDRSGKKYYCLTNIAREHLDRTLAIPESEFIPLEHNFATQNMFPDEP